MRRFLTMMLIVCAWVHSHAQTGIITTIAGKDTAGFCCDGGPASNAALNNPDGMCLDTKGNLYIADGANHKIRKIVLSTGIITTVAGTGIGGYNGDDIPATDAQLFIPDAVSTDSIGNIFIADGLNHRIRKVTIATGVITTVAGNGLAGNSGDNSQATDAQLDAPTDVFTDKFGNIYLADVNNNNVRKVAPTGIITTVAGIGTIGYSGDGGQATSAQFNALTQVCLDGHGNIVLADGLNNVLRRVDGTTGIITTIAGNGTAGYSGDGGQATHAKLCNPYGIFIDHQNNILFAEYCSGTIRKIDAVNGIISTVAGCGIFGYGGDGGPATDAKLKAEDLAIDSNGVMYVADYENNRIRKVYNSKLETSAEVPDERNIALYPNPANENITVQNCAECKLTIVDMLGHIVISKEHISQCEKIDIKRLAPSIYLLEAIDKMGKFKPQIFIKE